MTRAHPMDPSRLTSEPLSRQRLFQTGDLDEARAIVADKFCDHRLDIASAPDQFDASQHRAEGRTASLNYIRYGADVKIDPGELTSFYLIQIPLDGFAEIDNGSGDVETRVGRGSVLNPHRHTRMRWREGCAQLLLQIDAQTLHRQAERILGQPLSYPVAFDTAVDTRRAATATWVRKLKTCFALADRGAIFAQTNANTQAVVESELITEFLYSQPSNVSFQIEKLTRVATNLHVRRALQFIHERLQDPIMLTDIARAAGVTPRSLQTGFRAEFGETPMQYLRVLRLTKAKDLLKSEGDDLSIGDICHQVGIAHLGRFSSQYQKLFGEKPSDTRRASLTVRGYKL